MPIVKERPDFGPDQIRSSKEVKLGDMVIPVRFGNCEYEPMEVVGYFSHELLGRMNKGFLIRNSYGRLETIFHSDKGLLPYEDGWNEGNWLKRVNK